MNTRWRVALSLLAGFALVCVLSVLMRGRDADTLLRDAIRDARHLSNSENIARLDAILRAHPGHQGTLLERESYSTSPIESLGYFARIQQGRPAELARIRIREGNLLLELNRAREAEAAFREAVRLVPTFDEARFRLLPLLALRRNPAAVREQLQAIRDTRKLSLAEMALWITADGRLTSFSEAVGTLESFVKADPGDLDSLRALCTYLSEETQQTEALRRVRDALKTAPDNPELLALLANFLLDAGQVSEAAKVLQSLRPSSVTSVSQWHALGRMSFAVKDWTSARLATEFAATSTPFERSRAYLLYRILVAAGDEKSAALWQERSDALNSLHAEVETVGVAMVRKISDPKPVVRVAELLLKLDRPVEAQEWIEMAESMSGSAELLSQLSAQCSERLTSYKDASPVSPISVWNSIKHLKASSLPLATREPEASASAGIQLIDEASDLGLRMQYENGHTGLKYLVEAMGGGVSAVDFDLDGWPDLYCPQGGTLGDGPKLPPISDQLFRNNSGISFVDVSDVASIRELGYSQGVAAGDINGDGFDDLFVANVGRNTLFLNCGDGTFEDGTVNAALERSMEISSSAALADLDSDGDLDLYVVNYVNGLKICRDDKGQISTCNPATHEAAPDELYESLGDGPFRMISDSTVIEDVGGKGLGVIIAQLDGDRRPDIFVSNDTTPNLLFINHSGAGDLQFSEQGFPMGVAVNGQGQVQAGMGIACADLDHDLRPDLYVTNFHREANTLLLQREAGLFQDFTASAGLREPTLPLLGFGTQAVDLDLDGWMELFVANGHIDDQADRGVEWKMAPQLFRTIDGSNWHEISLECGKFMQSKSLGRGVAILDANRDGRPDLAIGYQDRPLALVINETQSPGNGIVLRLVGVTCNRSAINTVVYWEVNGRRLMTELCGGDGYYCSNEHSLTLGLGMSATADLIEIHWPDGRVDKFSDVDANTRFIVRQGMPLAQDPP